MSMTVKEAFNEFKSRLELTNTFQDSVTTHHNTIRNWVESYDSKTETKLIGSLQRKTKIQPIEAGEFDIDIVVVLGGFVKWNGITAAMAMDDLEKRIKDKETYNKLGPESDSPTISIEFKDGIKAELVPAYRDYIGEKEPRGRGYYVPMNNRWVLADYDFDAEYITSKNEESDGYLIPMIKMLKAAKRNLFPNMKSYHLEVLAADSLPKIVTALKEEEIQITDPLLVFGFFYAAQKSIFGPSIIPKSKSSPADLYMNQEQKQAFTDYFKKVSDHCRSLDGMSDNDAIEGWRKVFGEPFPAGS